jgi:micrococcal nuclease
MYDYECEIVRIIDGDSIVVNIDLGFGIFKTNVKIRLDGVDTPESRTRDLEEKKYGIMASDFVKKCLHIGSKYTLITVEDKAGKFGRVLGKIILEDGSILNDILIEKHLAVAYHGQSKEDIASNHISNREMLNNQ